MFYIACYHPLKGFPVGLTANGKPNYKIVSYNADHIEIMADGRVEVSPVPFISPYSKKVIKEYITVPCGKCIGCRLEYSRQWANRCMLEASYHESNYFVTLTYDDDHLPTAVTEFDSTGTLVKSDLQKFFKRLRRSLEYHQMNSDIRFYACGEYGERTHRPHYHAIIFGLELTDLEFFCVSAGGYPYFTSKFLSKVWKQGHVLIGSVSWDTCAYTARYIMKKLLGPSKIIYEDLCLVPEFTLMSRRPGIAYNYFEDHYSSIYETDKIFLSTSDGSKEIKPPRYYDNLFDNIDHNSLEAVKTIRKLKAECYQSQLLKNTDLTYLDALGIQERVKASKIKALKREL